MSRLIRLALVLMLLCAFIPAQAALAAVVSPRKPATPTSRRPATPYSCRWYGNELSTEIAEIAESLSRFSVLALRSLRYYLNSWLCRIELVSM